MYSRKSWGKTVFCYGCMPKPAWALSIQALAPATTSSSWSVGYTTSKAVIYLTKPLLQLLVVLTF